MKVQNYLQWFHACEVGDMKAVMEALPTYAKRKNTRGDTALILACKRGDRRITKLLAPLEQGICNDRGENAILTAIRYNQPGCVSDMCMYEIATRLKDGSTPLHFAAAMESIHSIVLMHGALKRARNSAGMTPFELACSLGKTEAVKKFIELGSHISKTDAARAASIAKEAGFPNIAEYISSFEFPEIDPSVITASMRLLQSSKVSSQALALVAEMSLQDKAKAVINHSKVMTESFRNEVVPQMEGLSESMRIAQQKVCQVVNRYEVGKKRRAMDEFVNNIDNLAFNAEEEKPTVSEEDILKTKAAERKLQEQAEAEEIQRKLRESAAERSRRAAERLAAAEQDAADREIELMKASASRMQSLAAFLPSEGASDTVPSPLPVTLEQLTAYPPSPLEGTFHASALNATDVSVEQAPAPTRNATQEDIDVDDIINQVAANGVVNDAYELYSSDGEDDGQRGGSGFYSGQRVGYRVPEGVEHYGSGERADKDGLDTKELERDMDTLRKKRQAIQERNRELNAAEDPIDTNNPFPIIGNDNKAWKDAKIPFPSVSNHENLDPERIVPRQYVPHTDAKGRLLHDRIDYSQSPSRSILIKTQGNTPADPNAIMGPAQLQGLLPADYHGIRLYCTCAECTTKLTEIASQLNAKDMRIAALKNALEETRAFAAACVHQMQECNNCYPMRGLKMCGYTDELIMLHTKTENPRLSATLSPKLTGTANKGPRSPGKTLRGTNTLSDSKKAVTLKIEEYGFIPHSDSRPLFPRVHEDVIGFHSPALRLTGSRSPSKTLSSSRRDSVSNRSPSTRTSLSGTGERILTKTGTASASSSMLRTLANNSVNLRSLSQRGGDATPYVPNLRGTVHKTNYSIPTLNNETELMHAAKAGNVTEIYRLIDTQKGKVDSFGRTALMYAAEYGHLNCVKVLVEHEDCVADRDGMTALMYAASFGHAACARILAEKEAGFKRPQDGATALMAACANGFDEIIPLLLDTEKRVQTIDGRTALMIACQNANLSCVLKMLPDEHDMSTANGHDALSHARQSGNALIIHEVEKVFRQAQHLI